MSDLRARIETDFQWQSAVREALALVPDTFKVSLADGGQYVVRYFSEARDELGAQRRFEPVLMESLASLAFVPTLYAHNALGVVYRWVDGQGVTQWHDALLTQLAAQLKTLHQFSQQEQAHLHAIPHLDLMQHIFFLLQRIPPEAQSQWLLALDALPAYKESALTTLGHHDLHHHNIVLTPDNRLIWLDWEYASWSNPAFDLASVIVNNELDQSQQQLLWQHYLADNTVIKKTTQLKKLTTSYIPWVRLLNDLWRAVKAVKEERKHVECNY
ncbi:phosphotransferase [Pasteurellaceae bacterium HPA106]|uniref:phosphotransferase n=1 Tax=Spirabiliibacterium pneumoniae TaxID=221400 RepID=UPI001AACCA24|nr:phosphotransferase [Spirabiliibacterium pneumoniae]MBE2895380.1 phosphotransferase [Spirabiliibacterium pneumoniae]